MIELFSRTGYILESGSELTPIHIDDSVFSLSAILRMTRTIDPFYKVGML